MVRRPESASAPRVFGEHGVIILLAHGSALPLLLSPPLPMALLLCPCVPQDLMLQQLVKACGLSGAEREPAGTHQPGDSADGVQLALAPVPASVPALPNAMLPRQREWDQVIAALLDDTASASAMVAPTPTPAAPVADAHRKVLVHGAAGLGKTVLTAAVVRDTQVRSWFDR